MDILYINDKWKSCTISNVLFSVSSHDTLLFVIILSVNVRDNDINVQWQIAKEDITEAVEKAHLLEGHYSAL